MYQIGKILKKLHEYRATFIYILNSNIYNIWNKIKVNCYW